MVNHHVKRRGRSDPSRFGCHCTACVETRARVVHRFGPDVEGSTMLGIWLVQAEVAAV